PAELPPGAQEEWQIRVSRHLSVGRVDEAKAEIGEVLKKTPGDGTALSFQSVVAVVQNEKEKALGLARQAVEADPRSASARIALSYAQQASFDLKGARSSIAEAVRLEPGNALAHARLAELWMSIGNLEEALKAARKAAGLDPGLARAQSVLGFAYLAEIKTKSSKEAFGKAIVLDMADPLPRLGIGLAMIREGDLSDGRREIEIAASLDPGNSLIRSYLGKAYYEEKRDRPASGQLEMAKELDPNDPTPYFYDAIRKQTLNRPVEALQDLQRSISLNGNRAVYRSRLLLDEDQASRSSSLGRIYDDLGFQQLALVEGWKSVNTDPANHSAHRFLADSYSALPRHETARTSELLQSQLLQPLNITPVQPELAESKLLILNGAGPASASFNEFNPLFNRNRIAFQSGGVAGSHQTFGDDLVFSGVSGPVSYSLGQFHYETDGFRTNDDLRQDIYNVFVQGSLSHKTSVQAEFRARDIEKGDLTLKFNPDDFSPALRQTERNRSIRGGFHHAFSPGSDLIGSFIYQSGKTQLKDVTPGIASVDFRQDPHSYIAELQHVYSSDRLSIVAGAGRSQINFTDSRDIVIFVPFPPFSIPSSTATENSPHHTNLYVYSQLGFLPKLKATLGGSVDFYKDLFVERNQFNPKLGLTWTPLPGTTLRAAAFRVLKRTLNTDQTIEPTQVAGFNQFFDDVNGTKSWRYGGAIDQKFSSNVYGGAEYSWRDLDVPFSRITPLGTTVLQTDWKERLGRAYLYWTPHKRFALSVEYLYEKFDRGADLPLDQIDQVTTQRFPVGISFFHPCGFSSRLSATYIDQEGRFVPPGSNAGTPGVSDSDRFWVVDASLGYRLPKRYGLLSVEAKNLFDKSFKFQDTDHDNPSIQPKRSIFFKFTLAL
ncbi:MAG TPA: tetratricopeptide repeat protein, partial [Candidatus Deferrimicrobiaceae bacterium]|nr:tetratricopeptide repeat protein [Candidatus Deferrimicrobiaceae bacterium]